MGGELGSGLALSHSVQSAGNEEQPYYSYYDRPDVIPYFESSNNGEPKENYDDSEDQAHY